VISCFTQQLLCEIFTFPSFLLFFFLCPLLPHPPQAVVSTDSNSIPLILLCVWLCWLYQARSSPGPHHCHRFQRLQQEAIQFLNWLSDCLAVCWLEVEGPSSPASFWMWWDFEWLLVCRLLFWGNWKCLVEEEGGVFWGQRMIRKKLLVTDHPFYFRHIYFELCVSWSL
jgi:hypothetical protein